MGFLGLCGFCCGVLGALGWVWGLGVGWGWVWGLFPFVSGFSCIGWFWHFWFAVVVVVWGG
jgi:hypothetical protein